MRYAAGILIPLWLIISGCEDPSNKLLLSQKSDLIVVDGTITSDNVSHLITLSLPYQRQNEPAIPVTGAVVTITMDNITIPLDEAAASGKYYTPPFKAVTGKTYTLNILYHGKNFTASDTPTAVETMETLQYNRVDSVYSFSFNSDGGLPSFIRYTVNWDNTTACKAGQLCSGEVYYYDLKTTDVNDIFKPGKEDFYFPADATVIRKKYSVSPEYRAFLRSMLSETEWHGGVFDVQPAPVATNLSEGAIGFFAVSTVVSDTTIIRAKP